MAINSFKDLIAWQKSADFAVDIYKGFVGCKDYSFRDQIQRASISISNNIAEGFARKSEKSFVHFLYISRGSAAEVESMLIIAAKLGYVSTAKQTEYLNQVVEIQKIITGLQKNINLTAKD